MDDPMNHQAGFQNSYPHVDIRKTALPSCWDRHSIKLPTFTLTNNNTRIRVRGRGAQIPAAMRADHPIPSACGLYYFEIKVVDKGGRGCISIGLVQEGSRVDQLPGWPEGTYGYFAENGYIYSGQDTGEPYGPSFSSGDVIGCGLNFADNTCFFTKNGQNVGVAFRDLQGTFYPAIGMFTAGETVDANFGQHPFMYNIQDDLKAFQAVREQVQISIRQRELPVSKTEWLQGFVSDYLLHHGYAATASAFHGDFSGQHIDEAKKRRGILNLIKSGQYDDAIQKVQQYYPQVFERKPALILWLRCREFNDDVLRAFSEIDAVSDSKAASRGESVSGLSFMESSRKTGRPNIKSYSNSPKRSPVRLKAAVPYRRSASPNLVAVANGGCEKFRSCSPEYFDSSTSAANGTKNGDSSEHMENGSCAGLSRDETPQTSDSSAAFYDASSSVMENGDEMNCDMETNGSMVDGHSQDGSACSSSTHIEQLIERGRDLYQVLMQLQEQHPVISDPALVNSDQLLRGAFRAMVSSDSVGACRVMSEDTELIGVALNSAILETQDSKPKSGLESVFNHAQELRTLMLRHGLGVAAFAKMDCLKKSNA